MEIALLLLLLIPWVTAPLVLGAGAFLREKTGWLSLCAPLTSLVVLCTQFLPLPPVARGELRWPWVPELGLSLSFTFDGLALFYGLLVTVLGICVHLYSCFYLDKNAREHRLFYFYLQLFTGALWLTVLSDHLLLLFVGWELTGLCSFLLIGFFHERKDSQSGARMALTTTVGTGLCLLVGILCLQQIYGSGELSFLRQATVAPEDQGLLTVAFLCCLVGIVGKSALFPFHFWLPQAMAAPTPVSAYLHSATLVKLGVFLTARLFPFFHELPLWTPLLVSLGFGTLLLGACFALLSQDLKAILAYTTVAQLGLLVGQYGLYAPGELIHHDLLHVTQHALYKACLFMVVGIIDHSTQTRDIRQLGGLWTKMRGPSLLGLLALAAFCGLPFTSSFVSKELLLEQTLSFAQERKTLWSWFPLLALWGSAVLHVVIAARFAQQVFFRPATQWVQTHFHRPARGLSLAPLLLVSAIFALGCFPAQWGEWSSQFGVVGQHELLPAELSLFHGLTPALGLSGSIFIVGLALFILLRQRLDAAEIPAALRLERVFTRFIEAVPVWGQRLNGLLGLRSPAHALLSLLLAFSVPVLVVLFYFTEEWLSHSSSWELLPRELSGWWRWLLALGIGVSSLCAVYWKRPVPQLIAVSVVGFGISLYFILYHAPDLALTQILIETATLFLVLFVLWRWKQLGLLQEALPRLSWQKRGVRVFLSVALGVFAGLSVLIFQRESVPRAGDYYLEQSLPLAQGKNAVNTTVVDFRGFDTLLEIGVLLIAALGGVALLYRPRLASADSERALSASPNGRASSRESAAPPVASWFTGDFILKTALLLLWLPLQGLALALFWRGHNLPGGGFVAGALTAVTCLLLALPGGPNWLERRLPFPPYQLAAFGFALSLLTVFLPVCFGYSLLHHMHVQWGPLALGTPLLFDLGVFLTVVGVVLQIVVPFLRSVHQLPAWSSGQEPWGTSNQTEPVEPASSLEEGRA